LQIEKFQADGTLSAVHLAFSRDQKEKVYVQHLMHQTKAELWRLLEEGGHIYVCGLVFTDYLVLAMLIFALAHVLGEFRIYALCAKWED